MNIKKNRPLLQKKTRIRINAKPTILQNRKHQINNHHRTDQTSIPSTHHPKKIPPPRKKHKATKTVGCASKAQFGAALIDFVGESAPVADAEKGRHADKGETRCTGGPSAPPAIGGAATVGRVSAAEGRLFCRFRRLLFWNEEE